MTMKANLDITPSPRLLQVLGDIPLQPWQCIAELVDNSLDELLKTPNRSSDNPLTVEIDIEESSNGAVYLVVRDNGGGMSVDELERSLRAGHSAKNRYGSLGLFGMGFNIATARLGNVTTVTTTQAGSDEALHVTIDFADIQKRESFSVPLTTSFVDREDSGTIVKVLLKREMAEQLRRPTMKKTLISQLGDVYSYLLRTSVPGLSKTDTASPIAAILKFNGERVTAKLPCVWSDSRYVTSYGQQVSAIQYIDTKLTAATACLDCGHWDRKNGPEICNECGSQNLELRERRIWGWLGIQRFLDSSSFGIDFIRYGRKILKQDKSIFVFQDPDTLRTDAEYPIEMPANQGRIVGEVHLDHVPVTYQKNDFDRQSYDWQKAVEVVRGTGPLKPKSSKETNDSPLATLFSAFRRNDPGLRYLVPGDGTRALHGKAREWAALFDKGVVRMLDDSEWYEAAARHQRLKENPNGDGDNSGIPSDESTGAIADLLGRLDEKEVESKRPAMPQMDQMESARRLGRRRADLSGTFKLGQDLGTWDIDIIATRETLSDESGNDAPAMPGKVQGNSIEIFVAAEHRIFLEFGRDLRDVALLHAASMIKDLKNASASVAVVYSELVQEIDDLRTTEASIRERIDRSVERLKGLIHPIVAEDPDVFWSVLTTENKQIVESRSAARFPLSSFKEVVDDGRFVLCADIAGLVRLIAERPSDFFDGAVFKPSIAHRAGHARTFIVERVLSAMQSLASFQQDDFSRQKHDIQIAQLMLDLLDDLTTTEELLA